MMIIGTIVNLLLAVFFVLYTIDMSDGLGSAIFSGVFLFTVLLGMHWGVCRTPKKSSEVYDSWKRILHDDKRATLIRWASIGTMFYLYIGVILAYPWIYGPDSTFWKLTIATVVVSWPVIVMFMDYSKAGTLETAKSYYSEVVDIFSKRGCSCLLHNVGGKGNVNPDTPLLGGLIRTDNDAWAMLRVINGLMQRYNISYSILDESNREWNSFVKAVNSGALNGEKRDETIAKGVDLSRTFCGLNQTVGGIAIWVVDSLESKGRKALESELNH